MKGKKLYRSTDNRLVGGVLAGLADYFEQDVVLWRLGAILIFVLSGFMPGLLVYLVSWIIIPEAPSVTPVRDVDYTVSE